MKIARNLCNLARVSPHMKTLSRLACACLLLAGCAYAQNSGAQNSDSGFDFSLHAHGKVTAADIGLPQYPGAVVDNDNHNSDAADLGFAFGATKFNLRVVSYKTPASPAAVFDFYRKPMARYGDVLECDHSRTVGSLQKTRDGLTCSGKSGKSDKSGGHGLSVNGVNSSDDHELRAGSPEKMRIVAVEPKGGETRISLVYLELPKDSD
jgi:hypothetical protein